MACGFESHLRQILKQAMKREYAIREKNLITKRTSTGPEVFKSKAEAEEEIRRLEHADMTYDCAGNRIRKIVCRTVTAWKPLKKEKK